jgi:hypothetical protein
LVMEGGAGKALVVLVALVAMVALTICWRN